MVQLRTQRTALALYGALLILPTVVLGGLQWRQLHKDYRAELAAVPLKAGNAARRLRSELQDTLDEFVQAEAARPFNEYANVVADLDAGVSSLRHMRSPLTTETRPRQLQLWFSFDLEESAEPETNWWAGSASIEERGELAEDYAEALQVLVWRSQNEDYFERVGAFANAAERELTFGELAVHRFYPEESYRFCMQYLQADTIETTLQVLESAFELALQEDGDGTPRLVATRRIGYQRPPEYRTSDDCTDVLYRNMLLIQGFFIDPNWLFDELPRAIAGYVLDSSLGLVRLDADTRAGSQAQLDLLSDLGIENDLLRPTDLGRFGFVVDTKGIERRFHAQRLRFLGLGAMLAITLGTGLALLLRSVQRDLEQARRTENFVASVTHELRTPISSIKLHGEMLLDGWTSDPERKKEYYRRITRETERLSTLVERVLEKSRLAAGKTRPTPGDLNRAVLAAKPELEAATPDDVHDVSFELTPELPEVWMTPESIQSIVVNLVENARKYAPVDTTDPGHEPIRVVTRREGGRILLEVLDRGPGIAAEERSKIFEAFYRIGNEATRTSRGTGLGLHLVALQSDAIRARVSVTARDGGGSIFRISLEPAEPGDTV